MDEVDKSGVYAPLWSKEMWGVPVPPSSYIAPIMGAFFCFFSFLLHFFKKNHYLYNIGYKNDC